MAKERFWVTKVGLAAHSDRCTLVTYDCRTIPQIAKEWMETDRHHGGIILIDDRTIRPRDIGRLLRAILELVEISGVESWEDVIVYLQAR